MDVREKLHDETAGCTTAATGWYVAGVILLQSGSRELTRLHL